MTEQIKSFIEWFEELLTKEGLTESEVKHFQLAIRSLEAWDEVLNELEEERAFEYSIGNDEVGVELDMCILIINQKLLEIEEVSRYDRED